MGSRSMPYLFCLFLITNAINPTQVDSKSADDIQHVVNYHQNYSPVSSTPHNPWISGPHQKKYQFHVGQQSWLAAREICLAENSDLLTIADEEELDWILSHYKPQLKQFRERQLQIGLLVDNSNIDSSSGDTWKWVDGTELNETLLHWTIGEPFDHAEGRERCGLLNINRRTIEDVDCDLSGSALNFYRFICQRQHLQHLKHEELNNPLWKKLEDILVFFGISQSSSAPSNETELIASDPQADDEDYMEASKLNTTELPKIEGSGEEPKSTENPSESNQPLPKEKKLSDGPPFPTIVHGTKIKEPTSQNDADLLEKLNHNQDTTTDHSLQRTTKSDPLTHLADTLESEMSKESGKTVGDRMHQLERIINAVQNMLEDEEKNSTVTQEPSTTTDALEIVQLVEKHNRDLIDQNLIDAGAPQEHVQIALNLEDDFEHSKVETLAHPNINSGDFLLLNKKEELIGCGVKRSNLSTTTISPVNKTEQVNKLLESLRGILTNSSSDVLVDLLSSTNDTKGIVEKLKVNLASSPSSTDQKSSEVHKRIEYEILKSLEDLRETESKEFVDMKSNSNELVAIGSGIEPPKERLINLTPVPLVAHQNPTNETLKKSVESEGFDVNVMVELPKSKPSIPESEEIENEVTKSLRLKFDKHEEQEGSGSHSAEQEVSLFPKPDFSLMKNKKLQEEYKKNVALEKSRVDKVYEDFNSRLDAKSLAERIKQSEAERAETAHSHKLKPEDENVGKALEQLFDEWISLFNRR